MSGPCPECGVEIEIRRADVESNYAGAMVFRGIQVKRGPEHKPRCPHYRREKL